MSRRTIQSERNCSGRKNRWNDSLERISDETWAFNTGKRIKSTDFAEQTNLPFSVMLDLGVLGHE